MESKTKHPTFFIVGHSKSGTTALSRFLHQHPQLFVCNPEEPNYFCPSLCRASGPPSLFYPRTEAEYLSLFDHAEPDQRCGEASAVYLYSEEAAQLISEFDPTSKVIMIFREPVDFLRSYHLQLLKNAPAEGETVGDLAEAIRLEPARRAGRRLPSGCVVPEMLYYATDRLRYDEHFDRFAERFPMEQILPLVYDDFRRDNGQTVRRVFDFLGVDPDFSPVLDDHNTGGLALRSRRMLSLVQGASHGTGLRAKVRATLPRRLRRRILAAVYSRLFTEAEPVDPDLTDEIQRRAAPHVRALGDRIGRDLGREWGYDERVPTPPQAVFRTGAASSEDSDACAVVERCTDDYVEPTGT